MFIWELNIFFAATVAYGKEISEAESSVVWLRPIDFFLCQDVGQSASTCDRGNVTFALRYPSETS